MYPFPITNFQHRSLFGFYQIDHGLCYIPFFIIITRRQTNRAYSQKADYKKIKFCFHFNNCLNGTLIEI